MSLRGRHLGPLLKQGFILIPLESLREITAADIDTVATGAGKGSGGVLGRDSTPILERVNVGTDPLLRLRYAATVVDVLTASIPTPPDLQPKSDVFVDIWAQMTGAVDTPALGIDIREGVGDTNFGGNTAALSATLRKVFVRGKGTNVFGNTPGFTISITPAAHGTDSIRLYTVVFRYTRKLN